MPRTNVRLFWGVLIALTALWIALNPGIFAVDGLFPLRTLLIQWTGLIAMAAMSLAMVLSLRPRWPEKRLGGLDKMYRLHKWLGITGLVMAVVHWLWKQAPKWAVEAGWIVRPPRGPRPEITDPVEAAMRAYRGFAEDIGEWAFYAAVVLLLVALVRRIPYHVFRKVHRVLPAIYLVLVVHSVLLLDYAMWATPVGVVLALMLAAGSWAAVLSLLGRVGQDRRVSGRVTALNTYPGVHVLESVITLDEGWPGHRAGQFAFVTSDQAEGPHPYTIASAWNAEDRSITFVTKALGDHTATLPEALSVGHPVTVEGPYGLFTFDDARPRQIWIGAGIGITPFIARLKELATRDPDGPPPLVDLFHSTREIDEDALARLAADSRAARVRLHLLVDGRNGRLTGERIRETVPDWRQASLWFCGPAGFGQSLRGDFAASGVDVERCFHQELFEMR